MIGLRINEAKSQFFDLKKVKDPVERATQRNLSRFGAFVRTRARTSIRKRKRASAAGSPPSSHVGLLKRLIFFVYDRAKRNVLIGPARLNQAIGDAPAALEHGGSSEVMTYRRGKRVRMAVRIEVRPFMQPAFEAERPKLRGMWADSVK
jgi:hypothetical protein